MAKKIIKKTATRVAKKTMVSTKKPRSKSSCSGPIKVDTPFNKSQIVDTIACRVALSKKEVSRMFDTLFEIIAAHLKKRGGPGEFTLPNVAKFKLVKKAATKARQGINPFTGEAMTFAAKPARNVIKVRTLKKIKDIAK